MLSKSCFQEHSYSTTGTSSNAHGSTLPLAALAAVELSMPVTTKLTRVLTRTYSQYQH